MKYAASRTRALGGVARRGARSVLSPAGLRGTAVEWAWVAAHVVSYPFGVVEERLERLMGYGKFKEAAER